MNEIKIVGQIDAFYFESTTNMFKVLRISVDFSQSDWQIDDQIVVTGNFGNLQKNTDYAFYGEIIQHPRYGEQMQVARYQQITPTTEEGLINYFMGDRFKGIGPVLAERIVNQLGSNAIEKIIDNPKVLDDVKGLRKSTAEELHQQLLATEGTERVYMQLLAWGFSQRLAERIYQRFDSQAVSIIEENPYYLIEETEYISFSKIDHLGEQLGFNDTSKERLMGALYLATKEICQENNDTYVEKNQLIQRAREILEEHRHTLIGEGMLNEALRDMIIEERLMKLDEGIMLPSIYVAEVNSARQIQKFMEHENIKRFTDEEIDKGIQTVIKMTGIDYDATQISALKTSIKEPMSIITGGPGTGKTTLIKGIILLHSILHDYDLEKITPYEYTPLLLAAPTGRASKRMSETTGVPASTIHRLIGYTRDSDVDTFLSNELEGELLIIDEMSMVDVWLMNWLMQAIPYEMQVIFVGDQNQLPSVGPGNVFGDMIESGQIPTVYLKKIYRQAEDSSIIQLAHTVRQGNLPDDFLDKKNDRTFLRFDENQILEAVGQIVTHALSKGFDKHSIQVLSPTYSGRAGINALNEMLQEKLNPSEIGKRQINHFEQVYRVGDKVLQTINDTENGVFNGDIGEIVMILNKEESDSKTEEIIIQFDDIEKSYTTSNLNEITLAYCISVHRAQGSEYPLVILPLTNTYSRLLRKDVLYTAITRAQDSLIMMGNPRSFYIAATSQDEGRKTNLKDLLIEALAKKQSQEENDQTIETLIIEAQPQATDQKIGIKKDRVEEYILTPDNLLDIDPMIGMESLTPFTFMIKNS